MKTKYEITGVRKDGERFRFVLKLYEPKQQKSYIEQMQTDPEAFFEKQQLDAARDRDPESISIPIDYCRSMPPIGDFIEIEVSPVIIQIDQFNHTSINKAVNQNDSFSQKKTDNQDVNGVYG